LKDHLKGWLFAESAEWTEEPVVKSSEVAACE